MARVTHALVVPGLQPGDGSSRARRMVTMIVGRDGPGAPVCLDEETPMRHAVGIDVGGTFIKAALVSETGEVKKRTKIETAAAGGAGEIENRIGQAYGDLAEPGLAGVGIGVPGMVRMDSGVVVQSPNIPAWKNYEARRRLGDRLGLEVIVDNDANMAAIAEGWKGAGAGLRSFMMITLGTGIGAGIVLDGKLWHGDAGRAGELGHVIVEPGGAECGCGARGCVERYASADGMRRIAGQMGLEADIPRIMELADGGDAAAVKVFEEAGRSLGLALSGWFNLMDVRSIIVGGGASPALRLLRPHIMDVLRVSVYGVEEQEFRIVPAQLGEDAGVLGAAACCFLHGR
jgi:glucokinase